MRTNWVYLEAYSENEGLTWEKFNQLKLMQVQLPVFYSDCKAEDYFLYGTGLILKVKIHIL